MHRFSLLALLLILTLCACQPAPAPAATTTPTAAPTACAQPGTQQRARFDAATRGWSYSYQIYLPPCYALQPERRYPVIYLLPGRTGGPGQWFAGGAAAASDEAILSGAVPPFILVGTEETSGDGDGNAIFADLVPEIDAAYRTLAERQHRAVAGASLGGSAAYRLAFGHPEHFASAGLFGAGLISGEEARLQAWLDALPAERQPRVFLASGRGGDSLMVQRAEVMATMLTEAGMPPTTLFNEGGHDYAYWVGNWPAYLAWVSADWR